MIGRLHRLDSRGKTLLAGAVAGVVGRIATLLAPLLVTPALLEYFGDANFGIWATAVSLTSIAVVADFGIGNGILTRVSAAHGGGNIKAMRSYVSSAIAVLCLVSVALFCMLIIGLLFFDLNSIAFSIFFAFIISLPGTIIYQTLYAIQRVSLAIGLQVVGAALAVLGVLASIKLGLSYWLVALSYALPSILITYAGSLVIFFSISHIRPSLAFIDRSYAQDLAKLGSKFFLLSILTAIGLNIDFILIASNMGAEAVSAYSIPMRLGSLLSLVIASIVMPLWGANGAALANGETAWVWRSATQLSILGVGIVAVFGALLLITSGPIIHLWVGRSFEGQTAVLGGFVLFSIATAATAPFNMILNATGRADVQIWPWFAFVITTIAAKMIAVSVSVWLLPTISAVAYIVIIMPSMIWFANKSIKTLADSN